MTAVIQRVLNTTLYIDGKEYSHIDKGLLILLGIESKDDENDCDLLADKIDGLRIFSDKDDKMNLSVNLINGQIMVVSQFTLISDTKKGKRPSFINAAKPEKAQPLYERFVERLSKSNSVCTGLFGADMQINLINDGPVTIIINSGDLKKK